MPGDTDGPADTAVSALRSLANGRGKPSLQELIDGLAHSLRSTPGLVEPPPPASLQIEALLASPPARITSDAARADASMAPALEGALRAMAGDYQDSSLERLPRVSEVLAAFAFVLRPEPQRFLRDADGTEITRLRPVGQE